MWPLQPSISSEYLAMNVGTPPACASISFDPLLKSMPRSAASRRVAVAKVHLVHALAVLAVVAFDLDAVRVHVAAQAADNVVVDAGVADRVAVEAGVQRRRSLKFFARSVSWSSRNMRNSNSTAILHRTPAARRAVEHAAQDGARATGEGCRARCKRRRRRGGRGLPRHDRKVARSAAGGCRRTRVGAADGEPAADHLLGDIPAEDHVALGEAVALAAARNCFAETRLPR